MSKKLFLTILFLCVIANVCQAKVYEKYLYNTTQLDKVYGTNFAGQTFTATTTHTSVGLKVWLNTINTVKQPLLFYLCETSEGLPISRCNLGTASGTENWLAYGGLYASSINPLIGGFQYQVIFDNISPALATNTLYAFIMNSENATSGSSIRIWGDSVNDYTGGYHIHSSNSGSRWTTTTDDLYFQIMGEPPCLATSEDMCVCTTTLNYIQNTSTGAGFWLDSSISFGDFLIATFLLGILILFLLQFVFNLEIPKRINFKKS